MTNQATQKLHSSPLSCLGVFMPVRVVSSSCISLQWRGNGLDSVSNHQPHDCLLNRLFRRRSKKTSKLRATGLCVGNSPGAGEFPAQMASNAENVSIWWRHHFTWQCNPYLLQRKMRSYRKIMLLWIHNTEGAKLWYSIITAACPLNNLEISIYFWFTTTPHKFLQ